MAARRKLRRMIGHDKLAGLFGVWAGDEEISATAWTEAGSAQATITVAAGPGGLILDYAEERDGATMTAHGAVSGDGWWWFDSYGFIPAAPGTAQWQEDELVLDRRSERGRTMTVLRVRAGRLEQEIATAVPADGPLVPLLRGVHVRREPQAQGD